MTDDAEATVKRLLTGKPEPQIGPTPKCDGCGTDIKGAHLIVAPSNGSKRTQFHDWSCIETFISKMATMD